MEIAPAGNPNMKSRIFARLFFGQSPASSPIRGFGGASIVEFKAFPAQGEDIALSRASPR